MSECSIRHGAERPNEEWEVDPYDVTGVVGVVIYLTPFVLVQLGRMETEELRYSLLNLGGAVCFLISLTHTFNLASFVNNIVWVVFSLVGIVRTVRGRRKVLVAG
ncbi:CBU_0592 family membrane protein [Sansalvadorimonas verongulae]|uniref:CBU_0592 family membrane protein n=1 Tax=Sansalvadorimonas verongulae TaxID=2172824 RepID=UPI0012BBE95A|nr:hypothetical protein [Sansalvadorimonas verongulae]MTI12605.1 hypothetical protein [Sansalvadorimonas verongulae]